MMVCTCGSEGGGGGVKDIDGGDVGGRRGGGGVGVGIGGEGECGG